MVTFFESHGLKCALRSGGIPCGYVLAPEGFGSSEELEVHGGVTWDGEMEELGPGRWIGFDAGHAGDFLPFPGHLMEGQVRDDDFMRAECDRLAAQIAKQTVEP